MRRIHLLLLAVLPSWRENRESSIRGEGSAELHQRRGGGDAIEMSGIPVPKLHHPRERAMRKKSCWLLASAVCWIVAAGPVAAQEVPENARQMVAIVLSGPFVVFRDKIMDELKLTDEQREKLSKHIFEQVMETGPFVDKIKEEKQADQVKKLAEHRQETHKKTAAFLKETLKPDQLKRFRQINVRYEGLFGLTEADRAEVVKELKLDAEQQGKLTALAQESQKVAATAKFPDELPLLRKVRREQNDKIKAILTEAQNKQWLEVLGQPFELFD